METHDNIATFVNDVKEGFVSASDFLKGLSCFSEKIDDATSADSEEVSMQSQPENDDTEYHMQLAIKSFVQLTVKTCEQRLPSHVFLNTTFRYVKTQRGFEPSRHTALVHGLDSLLQIHLHTQTSNPLQRWAHIATAANFSRQYPQIVDDVDSSHDTAEDIGRRTTEDPTLGLFVSQEHTVQSTKGDQPSISGGITQGRIEHGAQPLGFMIERRYGIRGDLAEEESLPDQPRHQNFRASLSTPQVNSARLLVEWWNGIEKNESFRRAFSALDKAAKVGFLDGEAFELLGVSISARTGEKRQYYQQRYIFDSSGPPYLCFMFRLYQLEFLPYHYLRRLSRKSLQNMRKYAAKQAACQRIAVSCLSSLLPIGELELIAAGNNNLPIESDQSLRGDKGMLGEKIPSTSPTIEADMMEEDKKEVLEEPRVGDAIPTTLQKSFLTAEELERISGFIQGEQGFKIGASICACPWLGDVDMRGELPYYLWDLRQKRRVLTEKLKGEIEYTAISHTWGRWIKENTPPAQVDGVDNWKIPENSKFEVRELPTILASFPVCTPYLWFDLVCIPQKSADPAIMEISRREIGRQASIFRCAKSAVAWFNEVDNWKGLESAIRRLSIHYLQSGDRDTIPKSLLDSIPEDGDMSIKLFDSASVQVSAPEVSMDGWFSSLWTLQEVCLRPDMRLCNKNWEILAFGEDGKTPFGIDDLVALASGGTFTSESHGLDRNAIEPVDPKDLHSQHIEDRTWIRSKTTESLGELLDLSGLEHLLDASRATILMLGNQRHCSSNRAEAIMSAVGVTDWYKKSEERAVSAGPDEESLDQYPLPFLREAAEKIGADIYTSVPAADELLNMLVLSLVMEGTRKGVGSMLPFTSGLLCRIPSFAEGLSGLDHPTVSTWKIQQDGSVEIRKVGIISYTGQHRVRSRALNCYLMAPVSQDPASLLVETQSSVDLDKWVDSFIPTTQNFAVCLHHGEGISDGILLKQVAPRELVKVGTYIMSKTDIYQTLEPITYEVSWRIL